MFIQSDFSNNLFDLLLNPINVLFIIGCLILTILLLQKNLNRIVIYSLTIIGAVLLLITWFVQSIYISIITFNLLIPWDDGAESSQVLEWHKMLESFLNDNFWAIFIPSFIIIGLSLRLLIYKIRNIETYRGIPEQIFIFTVVDIMHMAITMVLLRGSFMLAHQWHTTEGPLTHGDIWLPIIIFIFSLICLFFVLKRTTTIPEIRLPFNSIDSA